MVEESRLAEAEEDEAIVVEEQSSDSETENSSQEDWVKIMISHRGETMNLSFLPEATVSDLFKDCEICFGIPFDNIKFLVPKAPMLKSPLKNPDEPLADYQGKALKLIGSSASQIKAINEMCDAISRRAQSLAFSRRGGPGGLARRMRHPDDAKYTFQRIQPLNFLPNPERSEKLLKRLKEDPGIRGVMKKHKFSVGLLTEMEPLSNTQTSHEGTSRLLGLNRNHGEVIELRLRTDAHDGYRDYKTIRKTLCHELAHNVHGPHDRAFWDLCHQIEREVVAGDWKSGGRTIGETSRYTIMGQDDDEDEHQDDGGWTGGVFVLGGSGSPQAGMSRREILANAAQERQKKEDKAEHSAEKGWRPCQRSNQRNNDSK